MDEYQNDQVLDNGAGGLGLFGDDGDDDLDHQQLQQHQYEDDLDADDILGLDDDVDVMENPEGSLLMRFCPHDSSMLYPKESRAERKLLYACRLCRYTEYAQGPLIYQNILKKEVGNVLHTVPSAVSDDPTLPRSQNAHCEKCGHNEAVFFQSDTSDVRNDTLALIFVCCNCDHKWVA
eukprot:CCRYP_001624-RA/>CCRYP_001624-RA protein AED:0.06 eAED:0.06 QI:209/1/1/1/1/1/2/282/177